MQSFRSVWKATSTEAIVYQEGSDRINIEIPGVRRCNAFCRSWAGRYPVIFISETDSDGNVNSVSRRFRTDGTMGWDMP